RWAIRVRSSDFGSYPARQYVVTASSQGRCWEPAPTLIKGKFLERSESANEVDRPRGYETYNLTPQAEIRPSLGHHTHSKSREIRRDPERRGGRRASSLQAVALSNRGIRQSAMDC